MWKGYACGALAEGEAQAPAEEIAARKALPNVVAESATASRGVGSEPRSPEAMERRWRWTGPGWMPPHFAARLTMAGSAAPAVIAAEVARRGLCRLTVGHIAALAGVYRATVRTNAPSYTILIMTDDDGAAAPARRELDNGPRPRGRAPPAPAPP